MTCPTCGEPPTCLSEQMAVQATLIASLTEPGAWDDARDSRTCWETQEPVTNADGHQQLWCAQGHDWWTQPTEQPQSLEGSAHPGSPGTTATPMLIAWEWGEHGSGLFIERLLMTPGQREELEHRLSLLEAQGNIRDVHLGPEQAIPTPYEEFRARYELLDEGLPSLPSGSAA